MASHRDRPRLRRMFELAMTAGLTNDEPAVLGESFQNVPAFHGLQRFKSESDAKLLIRQSTSRKRGRICTFESRPTRKFLHDKDSCRCCSRSDRRCWRPVAKRQ